MNSLRDQLKEKKTSLWQYYQYWDPQQSCQFVDQNIENAIGFYEIPVGLAGLRMNGIDYIVPMASEEASVIKAAEWGGYLLSYSHQGKGIQAKSLGNSSCFELFFAHIQEERHPQVYQNQAEILLKKQLESMEKRGGGYRSSQWEQWGTDGVWRVWIDVADAHGAHFLNHLAECMLEFYQSEGFQVMMGIVSNDGRQRLCQAHFSLEWKYLRKPGFQAEQLANKIVWASEIAQKDTYRAVTHNKGIMNGMSALAMATGNDTRSLEASVHAYACQNGQYQGLSRYWVEADCLHGQLTVPVILGTVGQGIKNHPFYRYRQQFLQLWDSPTLRSLTASIGLIQNFSALLALVSEGIQKGHSYYHQKRTK